MRGKENQVCARARAVLWGCRRSSADPKADGSHWMEFEDEPPHWKTGWWYPKCAEGVLLPKGVDV